jgi:hypothetical protein
MLGVFLAGIPYIGLRAVADNGRSAVDGARYEQALFGGLPTVWLQDAFFSGAAGRFEDLMILVHTSWFIIPPAITLFVLLRYRSEFASYAAWRIATPYAALLLFALLPMQPPWMADRSVVRILALDWGDVTGGDPNPVAAMPSLHVALPLIQAFWAYTHNHRALAWAVVAYTGLVSFGAVFLGEHYLIDVLGAAAFALAFAAVARWIERRGWRDLRVFGGAAPALTPHRATERGQNLIEFAMLTPVVLVFIYAIVVFGLAMNTRASLQQAVREGARQASVGKSDAEVKDLAAGNAEDRIDPNDVYICHPIDSDGSQGQVGDPVRVGVAMNNSTTNEGYPYVLVNTGGIVSAFGIADLTVDLAPRATARLEKSDGTPIDCDF